MTDKMCSQLSGVDLDGKLVKVPCQKHDCEHFIQVHGKHPQTDEAVSEWGCAFSWIPVLTIENSQQQRQTGAAVESLRNVVAEQNQDFLQIINQARLGRQ